MGAQIQQGPNVDGATRSRALNALVAAHVFGIEVRRKVVRGRDNVNDIAFDEVVNKRVAPVLHYSTDIRVAWDVVDEMHDLGVDAAARVAFTAELVDLAGLRDSRAAAESICEAALRVLGVQIPR